MTLPPNAPHPDMVEIVGFPGYYVAGSDDSLWSYYPARRSGPPWYKLRSQYVTMYAVGAGGTVEAHRRFARAELLASVVEQRRPQPLVPTQDTTLARLQQVEEKLDRILRHLGLFEGTIGAP